MRLIYVIYFMIVLLLSCTDEPNESSFNVSVKNASVELLEVEAYLQEEIVFNADLNPNENSPSCDYVDEKFRGIFITYCGTDSIVFKFSNNRVYISTDTNSGNFNFSSTRNPLLPNGGFQKSGSTYEFRITQEDFENAFELPE